MIAINLAGTEDVFARFRELEDTLKPRVLSRLAQAVYDDVQAGADSHTKTGQLARSVKLRPLQDGYEIFHDLQHAPYAPFVHWGSPPHDIGPKDKKALRWATIDTRRFAKGIKRGATYKDAKYQAIFGFFFAKVVHHPGYAGDPYMVNAANEAPRHLSAIISNLNRT